MSEGVLTKAKIIAAQPPESGEYKMYDESGMGLYLLVRSNGSKLWRMKYRFNGRDKLLALGAFPPVDAKDARWLARAARRNMKEDNIDPILAKRIKAATAISVRAETFGKLCDEWLGSMQPRWSERHYNAQKRLLETDMAPLARIPLADITAPVLLGQLREVAKRAPSMAAKCRRAAGMALDHGIALGTIANNPAARLWRALPEPKSTPRPTLPPDKLHVLFAAVVKDANCNLATRAAFAFAALTAVRSDNVVHATWGEIHGQTWHIAAERMKMSRSHDVPITAVMREVLDAVGGHGAKDAWIFPGFSSDGALSENALLEVIKRSGFKGEQTTHGLRAAFSTWSHDHDFDSLVIELSLAHGDENKIRAVYNRSRRDAKRRELFEAWSAFLVQQGIRKLLDE